MARYIWDSKDLYSKFPIRTWLSRSQISDPTIIPTNPSWPIKPSEIERIGIHITQDKGLIGINGIIWWDPKDIEWFDETARPQSQIKPFDLTTLDPGLLIEQVNGINIIYTEKEKAEVYSMFVARSIRTRLYNRDKNPNGYRY